MDDFDWDEENLYDDQIEDGLDTYVCPQCGNIYNGEHCYYCGYIEYYF